jgi:hypothetical protein
MIIPGVCSWKGFAPEKELFRELAGRDAGSAQVFDHGVEMDPGVGLHVRGDRKPFAGFRIREAETGDLQGAGQPRESRLDLREGDLEAVAVHDVLESADDGEASACELDGVAAAIPAVFEGVGVIGWIRVAEKERGAADQAFACVLLRPGADLGARHQGAVIRKPTLQRIARQTPRRVGEFGGAVDASHLQPEVARREVEQGTGQHCAPQSKRSERKRTQPARRRRSQKSLGDHRRSAKQGRTIFFTACEARRSVEVVFQYDGGVLVRGEMHLHHAGDAREGAGEKLDRFAVGVGDGGHVAGTSSQGVQRVHDGLGSARRTRGEKHDRRRVAVRLGPVRKIASRFSDCPGRVQIDHSRRCPSCE